MSSVGDREARRRWAIEVSARMCATLGPGAFKRGGPTETWADKVVEYAEVFERFAATESRRPDTVPGGQSPRPRTGGETGADGGPMSRSLEEMARASNAMNNPDQPAD